MKPKNPKGYIYLTNLARKMYKKRKLKGSIDTILGRLRRIVEKRDYLTKTFEGKYKIHYLIKKRYEQIVINLYKKDLQKWKDVIKSKKKVIFYKEFSNPNYKPIELRREKNVFDFFAFLKMRMNISKPLEKDEQKILFMEYDYHDYYQQKDELKIKRVMNNGKNPKIISRLEEKISEHQQKKLEVEEEIFSSIIPLIGKRLNGFNMKNPGYFDDLEDVFMGIYYLFRKKIKDFDQIKHPKIKFLTWFDYHIKAFLYRWPWKNSMIKVSVPVKINSDKIIWQKNNAKNILSLDYTIPSKDTFDDFPVEDVLGKEYSLQDNFEKEIHEKMRREKIQKVFDRKLNERERKILNLRFDEGLTLQEIGDLNGVTKERIRQIEEVALKKLRKDGRIKGLYEVVNNSYR